MADTFYSFSQEEAKRNGELDLWRQSHQANIECAHGISSLIATNTQGGRLGPDCARFAVEWYGIQRVQFVLANTLISTGGLGFEPDSLKWARSVFVPPDKTNGEFRINADRALLAEFVRQASDEYQKLGLFGAEHCVGNDLDYTNQVLVLHPYRLKEECRTVQNQLWLGQTGFGCDPYSSGRAVYATCLGDGERARWNRADFIGVLDEKFLPEWAEERLTELRDPSSELEQEQTDGPTQDGMEMR